MDADTLLIHTALLTWYRQYGRDLPWRHTADPYAILVSEVMLQQTQVDRVIPKYIDFLAVFPTIHILAYAPVDAVIRAWASLGYNQRAIRLQKLASVVVERYNGNIPSTIDELLQLPGIGRYTAGAVACFAFHQPVATVDTNIKRVVHRLFVGAGTSDPPADALAIAESVLPADSAAVFDWNQALMDLGATICLSRTPLCESCPMANLCATYSQMRRITLFPSGKVLQDLRERRIAEDTASYVPNVQPKPRQSFTSTNRYFRGRIVDILRDLPMETAVVLATLGPQIKSDFTTADEAWLRRIIDGLVRDGLAIWADSEQNSLCLPSQLS